MTAKKSVFRLYFSIYERIISHVHIVIIGIMNDEQGRRLW